jgi:hypothetical protein
MATDTQFTYDGTIFNAPRIALTGTQPNVTQTLQRISGDYAFSIFEATAKNLTTNLSTNILNYGVFGSLNSGATPPSLTYSYFGVGASAAYDNTHIRLYPDANKTVSFDGRVGIGTTNPAQALEISGVLLFQNNNAIRFKNSTGLARNILFYSPSNNTHFLSVDSDIVFETSTQRMRLKNDGELWIGYAADNGAYLLQVNGQIFATNATIATSDMRYKENIKPLQSGLSIVQKLNPVTYNFITDNANNFSEYPEVGFIAQDVDRALSTESYAKSIVKNSDDSDPDSPMGIAAGNLIPLLVKAIQEQQTQIEALKQRIIQLENK